jgi:RHS repeat-associated protein/uncharacterized delta-60 repeat protein
MGNQQRHNERLTLRRRSGLINGAVLETLERRQMLSGIPDYGSAEVTAITSAGAVAKEDSVLQGPIQFPFANGQPKEDLVLASGKRLVAGYANGNWAMARYNSNGTIDTSFGDSGNVATDMGSSADQALNLHVQPDGKLLLLGLTAGGTANYHFALARYNADGSLDTTFGSGGKLLTGIGRAPTFGCVAVILEDGRIHVTGWVNGAARAMEYDANGKNGFDRLANKPALLQPLSVPLQFHAHKQPGTLEYYAHTEFVGPVPAVTDPLMMTPQDLHVVESGEIYTIDIPAGKSRLVDWGDGPAIPILSDTTLAASHTYSTAGTYTITTYGYALSLPLPYEFPQEHQRVLTADLSLSGGMVVDLHTNDLYIGATPDGAPSASYPFTTIRQYVLNGYGTHNPSLPQITSSDSRAGQSTILALFDNSQAGFAEYPPGFAISSHAVVGQYAYLGDTNLNGMVTQQDYTAVDSNLGGDDPDPGIAWFYGDTNFDDTILPNDYTAIDSALGYGVPNNMGVAPELRETLLTTGEVPLSITSPLTVEDSPATPTNLSISSLTSKSLKLTWDDNSRSEVGYRIEMSENNGGLTQIANWASASPNDTGRKSWRISGLNPGHNYLFRLFPDGVTHENTNFADISVTTPTDRSLYAEDFTEDIWNEWSPNRSTTLTNVSSEPSADRFLGRFGNTSGTVNLSLANMPAGKLNVSFDLYVMGAWDGNNGNDHKWSLTEGANNLLTYSFANDDSTYEQSYPDEYGSGSHPRQFEADATETLDGTSSAIYHISKTFTLSGSSLLLHFATEHLDAGETWGIDNVVISERGPGANGPATVEEGEPYTLDLSNLDDDVANWTIDWGDSQTSITTGATDSVSHTFVGNLGSYTIHPSADSQPLANIPVSVLPALPDNFDFTPLSASVSLTWSDNSHIEEHYIVQESSTENFTSPGITFAQNTTAYTWPSLSPQSTHYFRIGVMKGSETRWSANYILAKTSAALTTISTINAVPTSSSEITVTWTDTTNTGVGHDVQRHDGTNFITIATLEPGITSYTDWNLAEGQQYTYRVRANNGFETGTASSSRSAYTLLAAPGYLVAFAQSANTVELQWQDSSAHETGYVVESSVNGTNWTSSSGNPFSAGTTLATVDGLTANQPYTFRVYAIGTGTQHSEPTTATETTLRSGSLPAAPVVTLTPGVNAATLSWTAGSLTYRVERKDGIEGAWVTKTSTATGSFSETSLPSNHTFFYRVIGIGSGGIGDGPPSDEKVYSTGVATPDNLSATSTDSGAVELTWNDNSANETGFAIFELINVSGVDHYDPLQEISYHLSAGTVSTTISGLSETQHVFVVQAITPVEQSAYSSPASATLEVQGITATPIGEPAYGINFSVTLESNHLTGPINWSIDWGDGTPISEFTQSSSPPPHQYADPGDTLDHTYSVRVSAATAADGKFQATVFKVSPTFTSGNGPLTQVATVSASTQRKLRKQILAAFNEIYNTIQYEPYMGAKKGLVAVAQTKRANDWDQAALLASKLQAIWHDDRLHLSYVLEVVQAEDTKVMNWLGVRSKAAAENILFRAGVLAKPTDNSWEHYPDPDIENSPATTDEPSISFWHVSLKVDATAIGINSWILDPSWKYREVRSNVQVMGNAPETQFDAPSFWNQWPNESSLQSPLNWYETRLTNYIQSNPSLRGHTSLADIPYAGDIIAKNFITDDVIKHDYTNFSTNNEYSVEGETVQLFSDPEHVGNDDLDFTHRVHASLVRPTDPSHPIFDAWFASYLLDTDVISIRYWDDGEFVRPALYRGETLIAEQNNSLDLHPGDSLIVKVQVYRANSDEPAGVDFDRAAGQPVAVMLNGDQFSQARVNELQAQLIDDESSGSNAIIAAGNITANQSTIYQGRLLELIAARYASDYTRERQAISDLTQMMMVNDRLEFGLVTGVHEPHPNVTSYKYLTNPIFYTEDGLGINLDLPGNIARVFPLEVRKLPPAPAGQANRGDSTITGIVYIGSMLESSVLEELTHTEAVSTAKGFQWVVQQLVEHPLSGARIINDISNLDELKGAVSEITPEDAAWLNDHRSIVAEWIDAVTTSGSGTLHIGTFDFNYPDTDGKAYELTMPNRLIRMGNWTGAVWNQFSSNNIKYIIDNGTRLAGAFGTRAVPIAPQVTGERSANASDRVGDPVQPFTGILIHDEPIVTVATPGLPLSFALHYETAAKVEEIAKGGGFDVSKYNHGFGIGWTFNYGDFLDLTDASNVVWITASGQHYTFHRHGQSLKYANASGHYGTFVHDTSHNEYHYRENGSTYVFDGQGRLSSIEDRNANKITITYHGYTFAPKTVNYVSSAATIDPQSISFGKDSNGNITSMIAPGPDFRKQTWSLQYHNVSEGKSYLTGIRLITPKNPTFAIAREATTYEYYGLGIGDPPDQRAGALKTISHWINGGIAGAQRYDYYANGRAFSTTDPLGHTEYFSYNQFISQEVGAKAPLATASTTHTDYNGNVSKTIYDVNGNVERTINPDRSQTSQTWRKVGPSDQNFLPDSVVDEVGLIDTYFYGPSNGMPIVTNSNHGVGSIPLGLTTYTYDDFTNLTTMTVQGARTTKYEYDPKGNLKFAADALNHETSYNYYTSGLLKEMTSPRGNAIPGSTNLTTTYVYDQYGQLDTQTQTPLVGGSITTDYDYDWLGNLRKLKDATGNITYHQYDVYGRERATIVEMTPTVGIPASSADDLITRYDYNVVKGAVSDNPNDEIDFHLEKITRIGQRESDSNPQSFTETGNDNTRTVEEYDPLNRVVISALNQAVGTTSYDANGNVIAVEDALHNITHYLYDNRDRKTQTLLPDGGFARTLYDGAGRAVRASTPLGYAGGYALDAEAATVNTYDAQGRLHSTLDAAFRYVLFSYDSFGGLLQSDFFTNLINVTPYETTYNTKIDDLGRVIEQRSTHGSVSRTTYDANGNVILIDQYDAAGKPKFWDKKFSLAGLPTRSVATQYDELDRPVAIGDGAGNVSRTLYDKAGRVVATIDPRGTALFTGSVKPEDSVNFYNYDFAAHDTALPDDYKTSFLYDPAGRLITKTLPDMNGPGVEKITSTYYRDGRQKTETSVSRNALPTPAPTYRYSYANTVPGDPLGALRVTRTDPFNKTQITDSDLLGRVIGVMDENHTGDPVEEHHKTKYVYDSMGRKVGQILPPEQDLSNHSAQYTTYAYDQAGHLRTETDETWGLTSPRLRMEYEYDGLGRQTLSESRDALTDTLLGQTRTDYLGNEIAKSTDGRGIVTTFSYDYTSIPGAKIESTQIGAQKMSSKIFNSLGELTSATEYQNASLRRTTTYQYDDIGRVTKTIQPSVAGLAPDARSMSYSYDKVGNMLSETDALGHVSSTTYDAQNRKLTETLPAPGDGSPPASSTFVYTHGVLASMKDPNGNATTYTYDALDRVLTESTRVWLNPNQTDVLVATSYDYDAVGNVKHIIDRNGQIHGFDYDNLNRLRSEYPFADFPRDDTSISYSYDQQGRITSTNSERIAVTGSQFQYDALGRVVESVTGDATEMLYSYDLSGNRTKLITKWGGNVDNTIYYDYNSLNYLQNILQVSGSGANQLVKGLNFKYFLNGEMTRSFRYNAGTVNASTGNITLSSPVGGTKNPTAGIQVHNYDAAGRLTSLTFGAETGTSYSYDAVDRITNMTVFGVSRGYTYDDTDQLKQSTGSGASGSYTYDSNFNRTSNNSQIGAGNRLKSDGQWNYTYDGNGNLLSKMNFAGTDPAKLGDIKVSYTYDFRNLLTKVTTSTYIATGDHRHVAITEYWHNTDGRVTGQFVDPGDGSWSNVEYAYDGPNAVLAIGGADNPPLTTRYLYGLNEDEILAWDTKLPGSSTFTGYWLMGDHQGSIRREIKDNGTIGRRIDYDEFGNILGDKGFGPSPDNKYTGQIWYDSVKMYDYGARFYDPTTGRFINEDPAGQGTNLYSYTFNNPVNMVDPTGMEAFKGSGSANRPNIAGQSADSGMVVTDSDYYDNLGEMIGAANARADSMALANWIHPPLEGTGDALGNGPLRMFDMSQGAPCVVCHGYGPFGRVPGMTFTDSFVGGQWYHSGSNRNIIGNYSAGAAAEIGTFPSQLANLVQFGGQALSAPFTGESPSWSNVPYDTELIDERIANWVYSGRDRESMLTTSGRFAGATLLMVTPTPELRVPKVLNLRNWAWSPAGMNVENEVYLGVNRLPFRYVGPGLKPGQAGRFGDLKALERIGDDLTPHHMPQAAQGFTAYNDGGALVLPHTEHVLSRTFRWKGAQALKQEAGLSFREVLFRDFQDIRSLFGQKYNQGLRELYRYYKTNLPKLMQKPRTPGVQ